MIISTDSLVNKFFDKMQKMFPCASPRKPQEQKVEKVAQRELMQFPSEGKLLLEARIHEGPASEGFINS